jgi:hypothetical protein
MRRVDRQIRLKDGDAYDVGLIFTDGGGGLDFDAGELVLNELHTEVACRGIGVGKVVG